MGGVANGLIAPLFGALHITTALGVSIAPPLVKVSARQFETEMCCACPPAFIHHTPWAQADLYQKVFWGGLWGLLFLAPLRKVLPRPWLRAVIYGARPLLPCSHTFQALCSCLVRACMAARVRTGARAALPRLPAHHALW